MDAQTPTAVKRPRRKHDLVPIEKTSGPGKFFTRMVRDIETDLGGRHELARIESELIQAFSGSATALRYLTHQILLGEISELNLASYAQLGSTMLRIGSKLGIRRRARTVLDLDSFLELRAKAKRERDAP
jgi:hypothetical protein